MFHPRKLQCLSAVLAPQGSPLVTSCQARTPDSQRALKATINNVVGHSSCENTFPNACTLADSVPSAAWTSATNSAHSRHSGSPQMASCSLSIDDFLAEASPVLGRMRVDGLTETAVPFAEGIVVLWRRGAASSDVSVEVSTDILKVRPASTSVLS